MGEWCSKARLLTRAALRLRRKLLPRILEQQPAPQERAGESAFYASPPTSATNDNNRSVSFKCLSNFPALGFLIVSMLPAIYVPKRAETFGNTGFLFSCIPTDSTAFQIAIQTTDQKAGGSNPSRRTKSPRNRLISRTFAFHKFCFLCAAFF